MQSGPTPSLIDQRLITFVGFSVQAWSFAGRTWLSLILALFVAFWLELESPASAALTVASLSFPSRGQGLEKAFYRVIATIIGVIASIVITALFSETGWLLLFVLATWVGLCVYMASLFDGFRTYAAVLCIITVCLIAVEQLDTPQNVFILGLQRGAAIVVGILSLSLINAVFSAPNYYPAIADRLENLRRDIAELTKRSIAGDSIALETVGALLHRITALRPEITTLSTETSVGRNRSAAARTAMVDLIFELAATRTVASLRAAVQPLLSDDSASHADRNATENRFFNLKMRAMNWMVSEAWRRDCSVSASIRALRQGMLPLNSRRAPFYRSHRIALENGLRAFVYFGLAALVLVIAGWPATNVSLAFVGILIGLSAMSSDQSAASMLALFAVPFGCLLAGILEFVVLNGVTAYPLLAIGFLPFVIFPALLMTIPSPGLISFARSNLVFTVAIFSPSNPQSYDPQSFLYASLFLCVAAFLLFACQQLLPPLSRSAKLRLLLAEARKDLMEIAARPRYNRAREEPMFLDAVRIGQMVGLAGEASTDREHVDQAIAYFDRASALRLAYTALEILPPNMPEHLRNQAVSALTEANGLSLQIVAYELSQIDDVSTGDAAAALMVAGMILEHELISYEDNGQ